MINDIELIKEREELRSMDEEKIKNHRTKIEISYDNKSQTHESNLIKEYSKDLKDLNIIGTVIKYITFILIINFLIISDLSFQLFSKDKISLFNNDIINNEIKYTLQFVNSYLKSSQIRRVSKNVLVYIIIFINIIIIILREKRREEKIVPGGAPQMMVDFNRNCFIEIINISKKDLNLKERKKYKNENNKTIENKINKRKNKIIGNNKKISNYIIIIIIKSVIILDIFNQKVKNNIFDSFYYQFSNITLKIKGKGNNYIFGHNINGLLFSTYSYPNKVYINGIKQIIYYLDGIFFFNETDNLVELIWNKDITFCNYMFSDCNAITEINLSNFNTSLVKEMTSMFHNCRSLTSLVLSNFDTSQVIKMNYMFVGCSSLISLDLSNFNTSQVIAMNYMFCNCSSLTSLDLSNFNTSQVTSMDYMFDGCLSLTSLDLSNFNTSQVINMEKMFQYCSLLTSLDLSNFNTSKVTSMSYMFYNCSSLISLDLSKFNTSQVSCFQYMFFGCKNLEYINIKNLNEKKLYTNNQNCYEDIFYNIPENIVICINENNYINKIKLQIQRKACYIIDCSNDWKSKQKKITNNNTCIDSCDNNVIYKYEYNGKCYENCIYINDYNSSIINLNECSSKKCLLYPPYNIKTNYCTICNNSYYEIENDISNISNYINCYKEPEGYYLDKNDSLYKKCYYTCKTCEIKGNNITHNCIECNEYYSFSINNNISNYSNCYENCSYFYYFDNDNNYHCTINSSCPNEYPKLIQDRNECIKSDINDIINNTIIKNDKNGTKEETQSYNIFSESIIYNINNRINVTIMKFESETREEIQFNNIISEGTINDIENKINNTISLEKSEIKGEIQYYNIISESSIDNINNTTNNIRRFDENITKKEIYDTDTILERIKFDIKNMIKDIIKNEKNETKEEEIKYYDKILKAIETGFTSEKYNTSNLDNGEDEQLKMDKIIIVFTTTKNQKNNKNNNISSIDLGECEILP